MRVEQRLRVRVWLRVRVTVRRMVRVSSSGAHESPRPSADVTPFILSPSLPSSAGTLPSLESLTVLLAAVLLQAVDEQFVAGLLVEGSRWAAAARAAEAIVIGGRSMVSVEIMSSISCLWWGGPRLGLRVGAKAKVDARVGARVSHGQGYGYV